MVLQCDIGRRSSDVDLPDRTDLTDLDLLQSKESSNLLHHRQVCGGESAGFSLRVLKPQIPNPQDGREHLKYAFCELWSDIEDLKP